LAVPPTMSAPASHYPSSSAPKAEADRFPTRLVLAVGLGALVIFALATWITYRVSEREIELALPAGPSAPPSEVGKDEIGLINQKLFEQQLEAQRKQTQQERRLSSYGWVDRDRGVIRIPIDEAMKKMVGDSGR